MSETVSPERKKIFFCTCSGACPSMAKIDFWPLAERVRLEFEGEYDFMLLHPRLCEADGERLMAEVVSEDSLCVTVACAEKRQAKLLRDGFAKAGVAMDEAHWRAVNMGGRETGAVFEDVKKALGK